MNISIILTVISNFYKQLHKCDNTTIHLKTFFVYSNRMYKNLQLTIANQTKGGSV